MTFQGEFKAGLCRRFLFLLCLLVLSALALGACGGGGSDESQVEEVTETAAASNDPVNCRNQQTQKFTEQAWNESGGGAVSQCEEEAEKRERTEVAPVSEVEVDGSKATVKTELRGGILSGQRVKVELIKTGDQWKLNEIVGFTRFDERKLIENFEKKSNDASAKFASCFLEHFDEGGAQEVKELLLYPPNEEIEEVAKLCA